jgi:hypothetical protein
MNPDEGWYIELTGRGYEIHLRLGRSPEAIAGPYRSYEDAAMVAERWDCKQLRRENYAAAVLVGWALLALVMVVYGLIDWMLGRLL